METTNHLFVHCAFTMGVWNALMRWLGFSFLPQPNLFRHWICWSVAASNNRLRKGYRMIWHAAVWSIWRARNDRIFNYTIAEVEEIVEAVKVLSWRWTLSHLKVSACLFYEWCWNPKECLLR